MQLYRKVKAVEKIFRALGRDIEKFQRTTGFHCIEGCGVCCMKSGVEASPLEFLPLAYRLFQERRAMEVFEILSRDDVEDICIFFDRLWDASKPGRCLEHPRRGLICRLFGFSGTVDRNGMSRFSTCRPLKELQPDGYLETNRRVVEGLPIPRGEYYYMMLKAVDPDLMRYYPINTAIKKSLETVLGYYSYRRRRVA